MAGFRDGLVSLDAAIDAALSDVGDAANPEVFVGRGKTVAVEVEFKVAKIAGDPSRIHGAESGPGGLFITRPENPGDPWRAVVEIDENLHRNDVRHVATHELNEAAEIVRRAEKNPSLDVDAEQQDSRHDRR